MDDALLLWINHDWARPWLDPLMTWLSDKAAFGLPVLALLALLLHRRRGPVAALCLLLGVGLADAGGNLLKGLIQQPRPCAQAALHLRAPGGEPARCPDQRDGMPSNHALNFFTAVGFIALTLRSPALTLGLALVAAAVSVSRVYLGLHYPSQVLTGALLGLLWGLACATLARVVLPSPPIGKKRHP